MADVTASYRARNSFSIPKLSSEHLILIFLAVIVSLVSVAPLARLVWTALITDGSLDLSRVFEVLGTKRVLTATGNTLFVAVLSALISVVGGTLAALLVAFTNFRAKAVWVFALVVPLMIPPQVMALAWVQAFSPSGIILAPILNFFSIEVSAGTRHPLYSATGIITLLGLYNIPLVFISVRAAFRRVPADLIEAARANRASGLMILRTIIIPLVRPSIYAGAALAFVSAIGNFGIQAMLGIPARFPTLITLIYQQMNTTGPSALPNLSLMALLLALLTVVGISVTGWLGSRSDVRSNGLGQNYKVNMPPAMMGIVTCVAWGVLVITLALPMTSLVGTSLVTGYGQKISADTITLVNYANALFHHEGIRKAFMTSLWLTLGAMALLTVMAVLLAYFTTFRNTRIARFLQSASDLAYSLPGMVIAIAMILFFLRPLPVVGSLYGTPWIIFGAYIANYLALVLRPVQGGFAQIDKSLEEAAQVAGASFLQRVRDILWPLIAPAAAAGAIMVFMSAINEIQISVMLVSSRVQTIGPMIVFLEEAGSSTLASAVGVIMVIVVLILMTIISLFGRKLPKGVLPWQV